MPRLTCAIPAARRSPNSAGSRASLVRQGGPMAPDDEAAFAARPGARDAVALRRWDDAGKVDGLAVEPVESYRDLLVGVAAGRS